MDAAALVAFAAECDWGVGLQMSGLCLALMLTVTAVLWCVDGSNKTGATRAVSWVKAFLCSALVFVAASAFGARVGLACCLCMGAQSAFSYAPPARPAPTAPRADSKGERKAGAKRDEKMDAKRSAEISLLRRPNVFPPLDLTRARGHDRAKEGGPKKLIFSVMVNDLLEVNLIDEVFKPDLGLMADWTDDGLLNDDGGGSYSLKVTPSSDNSEWRPYLQFGNLTEKDESIESNTDCYSIRKRPVVCKYMRSIPTLRMRMPLHDFPFDVINLDTEVQFGWTTKDLEVVAGEMEIDPKLLQLNEYVLVDHRIIVQEHLYRYYTAYDGCEDPYPECIVRLTLARNPWYYIMRLVVPQVLLSCMELTSFLCDSDAVADRFSISGTIVLSEIALYFVAIEMLPKVPYVTRIDKWFSWCFLLVFVSCAQNAANYMLSGQISAELLNAIDGASALIYSIGVAAITIWFLIPLYKFQTVYAPKQFVKRDTLVR